MSSNKIAVYGLGPVGLATALCFAKKGYKVIGVDNDPTRVESIRRSEPPFFEPLLEEYLRRETGNGNFAVTTEPDLDSNASIIFVTVGTPANPDGSANLRYVKEVVTDIGRSLRKDTCPLVVVKSTVTPGTARQFVKPILERESGKISGSSFGLCSNPEFLREGSAIHDTESPDRIVIGSEDPKASFNLEAFYRRFHGDKMPPAILTTHENAELIKYANNAFLAMKVSYANMIANLCQEIPAADIGEVMRGIGVDRRIGALFLRAGLGWGGSCFPKDLKALISFAKVFGVELPLCSATVRVNELQPLRAISLAGRLLGDLKGKRIAILGLAFKPNTDDMRDAVSVKIVDGLLNKGANVVAYDPKAMDSARAIFQNRIEYAGNPFECIQEADCCIIVTEWDEFRHIPESEFIKRMRRPLIIDGRRIFPSEAFAKSAAKFEAIGLGPRTHDIALKSFFSCANVGGA